MTDEQIDEVIRQEQHDIDNWGNYVYSTKQIKNMVYKIISIMQKRLDEQSIEIAQKDAKIYAYETIIANSNFKAVLPRKRKEDYE